MDQSKMPHGPRVSSLQKGYITALLPLTQACLGHLFQEKKKSTSDSCQFGVILLIFFMGLSAAPEKDPFRACSQIYTLVANFWPQLQNMLEISLYYV